MAVLLQKFITRQDLRDNPDRIYVFGDSSPVSSSGDSSPVSSSGKWSPAASIGMDAKAKAGAESAILLARYENDYPYALTHVFAGMVGKKYGKITIKPDVWYQLNDKGQPVEVVE